MGRDRISELPDSLLTQILSYLPTKDSVKTSVLSNRWKFLWLRVPALDLRVDDFPIFPEEIFPSFIDSFLEFNRQSRMHKFKIRYNEYNTYGDRFREWIRTAVDRGVHHLVVQTDMEPSCRDLMPQNIFKSNTLVSLKLVKIEIENLGFVVSLPILKTMHLEGIWFGDDPLIIEKLISGCPVLEDLTLIRPSEYYMDEVPLSLRVRSQSLKWFRFTFENNGTRGSEYLVEIDAPRLEYLSFNDNQSDRILVKNLSSLSMVDIHTKFNVRYGGSPLDPEDSRKTDIIRGFLTGISSVRHMIISLRTIKVLCRYSELGTIPKFDSLYRLEATFSSSMLPFLPVFLESCPNLKNLILDFVISAGPEQTKLAYVPLCLSLNLECVEIKGLTMEEETWKQLAKYFLENSAVLRKLILSFKDTNQDSDVSKELLTYPKLSRKCQIIIN